MDKKFGRISLNLAGGGARGIWQFGAIKAWQEFGLQYDFLFGCSVGALNGCLLRQNELDIGQDLWLNIKNDWVYRMWPWDIVKPLTSAACLYDSSPLRNLCAKYIKPSVIKADTRPFKVNATEISNIAGQVSLNLNDLTDEEIPHYVKCSANAPIYFGPELFRGMKLIDGGVIDNFSIMSSLKEEADTIIVISPTIPQPKSPGNMLDMLGIITSLPQCEFLTRETQFVNFLNNIQEPFPNTQTIEQVALKKVNLVVIQPTVPLDIALLDFNYKEDRQKLINSGYEKAMEILSSELA